MGVDGLGLVMVVIVTARRRVSSTRATAVLWTLSTSPVWLVPIIVVAAVRGGRVVPSLVLGQHLVLAD